jgi:hypothetical protein
LDLQQPVVLKPGEAQGTIIHIDRFGNLVTSFSRDYIKQMTGNRTFQIEYAGRSITQIVSSYSFAPPGELCGVFGSSDYVEISVANGSARDMLNAQCGDCVKITAVDADSDVCR